MTKLTQAQVRRNIAIRNKMKVKAAQTPATEPKQPFKATFEHVEFTAAGRSIETAATKDGTPYVTMKADGQRTVMAFGKLAEIVASGTNDVILRSGRGAAKIVALIGADGSMTDENGEAFDLDAAQAA